MTPQQQTWSLFAGIGAILVVASLVGWALKLAVAKGAPHATIDNLNARIKAWWVMVGVIGFAFLFGALSGGISSSDGGVDRSRRRLNSNRR